MDRDHLRKMSELLRIKSIKEEGGTKITEIDMKGEYETLEDQTLEWCFDNEGANCFRRSVLPLYLIHEEVSIYPVYKNFSVVEEFDDQSEGKLQKTLLTVRVQLLVKHFEIFGLTENDEIKFQVSILKRPRQLLNKIIERVTTKFPNKKHIVREYLLKIQGKQAYLDGDDILFNFEDVREAAVKGQQLYLEIIPKRQAAKINLYRESETASPLFWYQEERPLQ